MLRSGLALAGAQRTIDAWARGESVSADNDGIVTAEEIATLDLRNTGLVVLSACDTGLGEARSGEGVLGLRRGFIQAGAKNLLMTLWPIDDERTADLIADFYAADKKHGNAATALSEVQRKWLSRLRTEKGIAEACRVAGPFILSFQGNPR
jgi:CHAT domain-containing protein